MNKEREGLKQAIVDRMLREHVGQENSVMREELALVFDETDRECRKAVEEIVVAGRLPIGGLPRPPFGYFVINTQKEYEMVRADLTSRIQGLRDRLDGLEVAWQERCGQTRLDARERIAEMRGMLAPSAQKGA